MARKQADAKRASKGIKQASTPKAAPVLASDGAVVQFIQHQHLPGMEPDDGVVTIKDLWDD